MALSRFLCLLCIGIVVTGSVSAAPARTSNRTKILGIWEVTKSDDGTPPGTTIEFTKDGKLKVKTKVGDETLTMEGDYKLVGNKLTLTIKTPDGMESTENETITKLTSKELALKDEKGQIDEFKRKK